MNRLSKIIGGILSIVALGGIGVLLRRKQKQEQEQREFEQHLIMDSVEMAALRELTMMAILDEDPDSDRIIRRFFVKLEAGDNTVYMEVNYLDDASDLADDETIIDNIAEKNVDDGEQIVAIVELTGDLDIVSINKLPKEQLLFYIRPMAVYGAYHSVFD